VTADAAPHLVRLRLRDFRNFERLDWTPPGPRVLLLGPNGAGKTTLLEAVYVATTTRSFRAPRLAACARHGGEGFSVVAEVGERPRRELVVSWSEGARQRRLDGREAPLAEHLGVLPVLAWSPEDAEIVAGGPAARRRYLDRGLVHLRPALLEDYGRYRQALGEKRALLARGGGRGLEAWNELLARHGAPIAAARETLAREVEASLAELAARHLPELPPIRLRYRPSHAAALDGAEALAAVLARAAGEESERRQPLVGPHRDELELSWNGRPARQAASGGEAKLLGLLLVAALARRLADDRREPLLLVDDADSELDPSRLAAAAAALGEFRALLLTSNRPGVWEGVGGLARETLESPGAGPPKTPAGTPPAGPGEGPPEGAGAGS
jgi:DNA replication and repair protein RecF